MTMLLKKLKKLFYKTRGRAGEKLGFLPGDMKEKVDPLDLYDTMIYSDLKKSIKLKQEN